MSYPNRTHSISEGEGTFQHLAAFYTKYLRDHCPPGGRTAEEVKARMVRKKGILIDHALIVKAINQWSLFYFDQLV